jgi:hypothetical protein
MLELLLVVALLATLTALSVAGLRRARMAGNEASAVATLRAINSGEIAYSAACAKGGFAIALDDLAKPPAGQLAAFIGPDLGTNGVAKSGYAMTLAKDGSPSTNDLGTAASTCNASANNPASAYFAKADPIGAGTTGSRYFATDSRNSIFQDSTATIANPIVSSATTVPVQ